MLDFLFITSPSYAANPHPPYYFIYLAAYLRAKGLKVKILDPKGGDKDQDIEKHLEKIHIQLHYYDAHFIGLAAFHNDYPMIMKLGKMIKKVQPATTLLVGNAHATLDPQDFIYDGSPFDIAVLGEGEETCWELWKTKEKQKGASYSLDEIKGIAYFYKIWDSDSFSNAQEMVKTEPRSFIDLKDLPMPAYDLIDMDWYLRPQKLIIRRLYTSVMPIFAGRGCAWHCTFCSANTVWKANKGKAVRMRPVDNVLQEINYLVNVYKLDFFYMFDDTFGMDKEWMKEWFYKKNIYICNVPYACQTRVNLIDETLVRGLKETGCIQVDLGVESGSQELLDRIHKQITVGQVQQSSALVRQQGMRQFFTMLLNLPGEQETDLQLSAQLLEELKPEGVIFGITTPYPGTKIYSECCPEGLSKGEYSLLTGNRLAPLERFRMADHKLDLWDLFDKWNRRFLATPFFERMWPTIPLYWDAVWGSARFSSYVWCWIKDVFKTPCIWVFHKTKSYRWIKGLQYGRPWK
jgi:radical SAM superfamily enzyme YgiQ (UPF0313 family)